MSRRGDNGLATFLRQIIHSCPDIKNQPDSTWTFQMKSPALIEERGIGGLVCIPVCSWWGRAPVMVVKPSIYLCQHISHLFLVLDYSFWCFVYIGLRPGFQLSGFLRFSRPHGFRLNLVSGCGTGLSVPPTIQRSIGLRHYRHKGHVLLP